jgi:hypothetical protein
MPDGHQSLPGNTNIIPVFLPKFNEFLPKQIIFVQLCAYRRPPLFVQAAPCAVAAFYRTNVHIVVLLNEKADRTGKIGLKRLIFFK